MHPLPLALTPFVGILIAALTFASSRMRHQTIGEADYYKFPAYLAYMMLGVTVFGAWAAVIPWKDSTIMPWIFGFVACLFTYAAAYLLHYRVVVTGDVLTVGAFLRSRIPLASVIDTDIKEGGRSRELIIYARDGRRIRISGLIGDLEDLEGNVRDKMAGPGDGLDSPEKLKDRANRNRNDAFDALLLIGILALGIYVLIWVLPRSGL
jgi:hypothetical protein